MFRHKQEEDLGGDTIRHQYMFSLNTDTQVYTRYHIKLLVCVYVCAYLHNTFVKIKPY